MGFTLTFGDALAPKTTAFQEGAQNRWIYLGCQPALLKKCIAKLGAKGQVLNAQLLEEEASALRLPFTHWISELAAAQTHLAHFWMITFSSRSPEASEFFNLICLASVARKAIAAHPDLVIVIDDPWLFVVLEQLPVEKTLRGAARAHVLRMRDILNSYARRAPARFVFFVRAITRALLARVYGLKGDFKQTSVALVSYAFRDALKQSPYRDPFFGDLPRLLQSDQAAAYDPFFLFPLHTQSGDFKQIQAIPKARAVAAWSSFGDIVCATLAIAKVNHKETKFAGLDIRPLLRRELLLENASNRYCLNRWQLNVWKRLENKIAGHVITIFENHPWEKALNCGLQKAAVRRIGYQHSTAPEGLMNYIPGGKSEMEFHPQFILANTPESKKNLIGYGWPEEKVGMGGSLRYAPVGGMPESNQEQKVLGAAPVLYVVMPGVRNLAENFLSAMIGACALAKSKVHVLIKFHPSVVLSPVGLSPVIPSVPANAPAQIEVTSTSVKELSAQIDAVLFVSSTVGLEALLLGLPVFRYLPESLFTLDPIPPALRSQVKTCDEKSLVELLNNLQPKSALVTPHSRLTPEDSATYLGTPVDLASWRKALRD